MPNKEEANILSDYGERYRIRDFDAALAVEQATLGTRCGANGYTTLEQADLLAELLPLDKSSRVLDVGCGCGWPGLHLARVHGCSVVGSDLPLEGLIRAGRNAVGFETSELLLRARATARALPFRPCSFDAIVHADVLC